MKNTRNKSSQSHPYNYLWFFIDSVAFLGLIRASVDALCRDGPGEISRDHLQRGRLTRQGTTSLASKAHRYDSQTHL